MGRSKLEVPSTTMDEMPATEAENGTRRVLLNHPLRFLIPGGQLLMVVTLGSVGFCDMGLDLVSQSMNSSVKLANIKGEFQLAGFDLASGELVEAKTVNALSVLPGEGAVQEVQRVSGACVQG